MGVTTNIIILVMYLAGASLLCGLLAPLGGVQDPNIPSLVDRVSTSSYSVNTTECTYNLTTGGTFFVDEGEWECNITTGLTATGTGKNRILMVSADTRNTTVKNTYVIHNPGTQEFKVFLTWSEQSFEGPTTTELQVLDDQIWLGQCTGWGLVCNGIDSEPIDKTGVDPITITTTYDFSTVPSFIGPVIVDGVSLSGSGKSYSGDHFGGVEVVGDGLSIETFNSSSYFYYKGLDVTTPTGLVSYVLLLIGWNAPGFDIYLNIILFKIPLLGLIVSIIAFVKPIGGY